MCLRCGGVSETILYSEARDGSRKQGHPLLRYSDICKCNMKLLDMNVDTWEECALQRSLWKENVTKAQSPLTLVLQRSSKRSYKVQRFPISTEIRLNSACARFLSTKMAAHADLLKLRYFRRTKLRIY